MDNVCSQAITSRIESLNSVFKVVCKNVMMTKITLKNEQKRQKISLEKKTYLFIDLTKL